MHLTLKLSTSASNMRLHARFCSRPFQRYNGYIYVTAHVRDVLRDHPERDGCTYVVIQAGFEVAPGDANDIAVANAYPWGSERLVFSDGSEACSALDLKRECYREYKGTPPFFIHKCQNHT
jgi:hypothetical protein